MAFRRRVLVTPLEFQSFGVDGDGKTAPEIMYFNCPKTVNENQLCFHFEQIKRSYPRVQALLVSMEKRQNDIDYVAELKKSKHSNRIIKSATQLRYEDFVPGMRMRLTRKIGEDLIDENGDTVEPGMADVKVQDIFNQPTDKTFDHENPFSRQNISNMENFRLYGENFDNFNFKVGTEGQDRGTVKETLSSDSGWFSKLPNLLDKLSEANNGERIEGVTHSMIYIATVFTGASFHIEDYFLGSLNYNFNGSANKYWLIVHSKYMKQLSDIFKDEIGELKERFTPWCKMFIMHKYLMVDVELLKKHKIPYYIIVQKPNTMVVTFATAAHGVINSGDGVAIAKNWCYRDWFYEAREIVRCECPIKAEGWIWLWKLLYGPEKLMIPSYSLRIIPKDAFKIVDEFWTANELFNEECTVAVAPLKRSGYPLSRLQRRGHAHDVSIIGDRMFININGTVFELNPSIIEDQYQKEEKQREGDLRRQVKMKLRKQENNIAMKESDGRVNKSQKPVKEANKPIGRTTSKKVGQEVAKVQKVAKVVPVMRLKKATVPIASSSLRRPKRALIEPLSENDDESENDTVSIESDNVITEQNPPKKRRIYSTEDEDGFTDKEDNIHEQSTSTLSIDQIEDLVSNDIGLGRDSQNEDNPEMLNDESNDYDSFNEQNLTSFDNTTPNTSEYQPSETFSTGSQKSGYVETDSVVIDTPRSDTISSIIQEGDATVENIYENDGHENVQNDEDSIPTPSDQTEEDSIPTPSDQTEEDSIPTPSDQTEEDSIPTPSDHNDDEDSQNVHNPVVIMQKEKQAILKKCTDAKYRKKDTIQRNEGKLGDKRSATYVRNAKASYKRWDAIHLLLKALFKTFGDAAITYMIKYNQYDGEMIIKQFVSQNNPRLVTHLFNIIDKKIEKRVGCDNAYDESIYDTVESWKKLTETDELIRTPADDPVEFKFVEYANEPDEDDYDEEEDE